MEKATSPTGIIDSLKNYPGTANDATLLTANFGWTLQEVAFQWFLPAAGGKVKEIWWRNYSLLGDIKKATVRAWYANPKVDQAIPASVLTKYIGTYKDPTDGYGLVTPFKPATGDQWFYKNGLSDSTLFGYDPLGTEVATWLPGGLQVPLDSGKWQGIVLESWGNSMFVNLGQKFGFTIMNDSKVSDVGPTEPVRMEILSYPSANPPPYHSYKFYETGRTSAADKGWHMRGDYEWGMYVVIEYTTDKSPTIVLQGVVQTAFKTTPRPITVTVTDENPGGGPAGLASVYFKCKNGAMTLYDSVVVTGNGSNYTGIVPATSLGDTIYWQFAATDVNGNRTVFGPRSYVVFKNTKPNLFLYNFQGYSSAYGMDFIYVGNNSQFNRWSAINDGIDELADVLALYNNVLVADGSFPSRNIYPSLKKWFEKGTAAAKKNLFFSSQDYGGYITPTRGDTTFTAGSLEFDYLGVLTLGPQDVGPTNRPYQIVPQPDWKTNYLINYNKDSSTTLWHYPTFEIGFSAYPDVITPKAGAKAIFKDGTGILTLGVLNSGATFNSMFVAFDAAALQFRSDTSLHNATYTQITDPKYQWIADVGSLAVKFLCDDCGEPLDPDGVDEENERSPFTFFLEQNYPNPFNPTTMISYQIPVKGFVTLKVFDLLGREAAQLMNEEQQAGGYSVQFDGKNLSSGLYFYQLQSGNFIDVKKMMILK